ncbi:hypothetical protein Lal_00007540 [Lupinus albus]|uniref:Uncharacterized protein n=1 Tax=Lupinus albus TaxID=3870 RepID=A0A6A5MJP9_LUPAL|nr:hypothetical protein Lalb_Chr16g0383821 [Lupinus albus]KAF1874924.1 hypothetical protein Lal_00007540 [Lupinus albus]
MAPLLLLFFLMTSFTVFAEELHTLPSTSPPPHHHSSPHHHPTHSPLKPPHHHHHHHHHPLASAPAPKVHHSSPHHHPTHSPLKPPHHHHHYHHHHYHQHPPASAPAPKVHHHVPRTYVSVQGVVYVKSSKYAGKDTLLEATPLLGAIVKFQCNNTKYELVQTANTDKNGNFFLEASKKITNYGAHKCNVVLVSAPNGLKPSNFNGGITGSPLRLVKAYISPKGPFTLYNVGPFAFEPKGTL